MSRADLVEAYMEGRIGKRLFVKRLVAVGVSLTAAFAYAEINPHRAQADASTGFNIACQHFPQQAGLPDPTVVPFLNEKCGG